MSRKEILENLDAYLYGNRTINLLKFKDGKCFQADCIIFAEDGPEAKLEAVDDEHPDGYFFTIEDIEVLRVY